MSIYDRPPLTSPHLPSPTHLDLLSNIGKTRVKKITAGFPGVGAFIAVTNPVKGDKVKMEKRHLGLLFCLVNIFLNGCAASPKYPPFARNNYIPQPSPYVSKPSETPRNEWKDDLEVKHIDPLKSSDMVSEIEKLKKIIKTHSEKNRYESFDSKLNFCSTLDKKPLSFLFTKKKYNKAIEFSYSTSSQETTVTLKSMPFNQTTSKDNGDKKCNADGYFSATKAQTTGSYIGSNAFGVSKTVTKANSMTYMLAPLNKDLNNGIDRHGVTFKFKISPNDAQTLEDNLAILVSGETVCNKCSANVVDFTLVGFNPTLDFPVDGVGFVFGLYFKIDSIMIVDAKSKKVYLERKF